MKQKLYSHAEDELEEISLWIEANRDVPPQRWVEEIWPHIEKLISAYTTNKIIGELENLIPEYARKSGDRGMGEIEVISMNLDKRIAELRKTL